MDALALPSSGLFLLEILFKGALLLAAAFLIALALHRASAAMRHAVWSLAFTGLLLLPLGALLLPSWQVAVPDISGLTAQNPVQYSAAPTAVPQAFPAPSDAASALPEATHGAPAERHASPDAVLPSESAVTAGWSWPLIALLVWVAGTIGFFIRLALVMSKLSLLTRRATEVTDPEWTELSEVISEVLDIQRPVRLLRHEAVVVPMTYGVHRPVIFLPAHADSWSEDQKHVTLMHELLHVQRYDHLVHLIALSARALHWFNPLAWAATKRLLVERERACDDGVLAMGVRSTTYADHLLGMARYVLTGQEASAGALAMARSSELRSRIVAILDAGQRRHALTKVRAVAMVALALPLIVTLAAMKPEDGAAQDGMQDAPSPFVRATVMAHTGGVLVDESSLSETLDVLGMQEAPNVSEPMQGLGDELTADTFDVEAQRRALHAISELPLDKSIPLLTEIAQTHPNTELRAEAVFWLGQAGDASVADVLAAFARNDASQDVQRKAIFALSQLSHAAGVPLLTSVAQTHPNDQMRAEAVFWIAEGGGPEVAALLADFARNDESRDVQRKAIFALSEVSDGAGLRELMEIAKTHSDAELRGEAVFWLGQEGDTEVADVLETFARSDPDRSVQEKAVHALAELSDNAGVTRLIDLATSHPDSEVRNKAIFWLGDSGDPRAADVLMRIARGQ